jgi:hypothetical protein
MKYEIILILKIIIIKTITSLYSTHLIQIVVIHFVEILSNKSIKEKKKINF